MLIFTHQLFSTVMYMIQKRTNLVMSYERINIMRRRYFMNVTKTSPRKWVHGRGLTYNFDMAANTKFNRRVNVNIILNLMVRNKCSNHVKNIRLIFQL